MPGASTTPRDHRHQVVAQLVAGVESPLVDRGVAREVADDQHQLHVPVDEHVVVALGQAEHVSDHRDGVAVREPGDQVDLASVVSCCGQFFGEGGGAHRHDLSQDPRCRPVDLVHQPLEALAPEVRSQHRAVLCVLAALHGQHGAAVDHVGGGLVAASAEAGVAVESGDPVVGRHQECLHPLVPVDGSLVAQPRVEGVRVGEDLGVDQRGQWQGGDRHQSGPFVGGGGAVGIRSPAGRRRCADRASGGRRRGWARQAPAADGAGCRGAG